MMEHPELMFAINDGPPATTGVSLPGFGTSGEVTSSRCVAFQSKPRSPMADFDDILSSTRRTNPSAPVFDNPFQDVFDGVSGRPRSPDPWSTGGWGEPDFNWEASTVTPPAVRTQTISDDKLFKVVRSLYDEIREREEVTSEEEAFRVLYDRRD